MTTTKTTSKNLEGAFLEHVCKNQMPLTVFLVNGVKLQGSVTWVDNTSLLLSRDGHSQLVYITGQRSDNHFRFLTEMIIGLK